MGTFVAVGIDLTQERLVGLGSVCRRDSTAEIAAIVTALWARGIRLHGFGAKRDGLARIGTCSPRPTRWPGQRRRGTRASSCPAARIGAGATTGRNPADIEAVALTHLHADHVGWAWHPAPDTDGPAFTKAQYLVAEPERAQRHLAEEQGTGDMLKVMQPQVRTVAEGEAIFPASPSCSAQATTSDTALTSSTRAGSG
ncbi:MBL fold metallo-hydrolase [Amycolatopsis sp. NPDC051903]|uniref:deazapurine DNA modification protein DpdA family protein n=1 Tax=Amycolatopsis sp. NPDC051903 TaxID=3363936 RepID=UPI003792A33D